MALILDTNALSALAEGDAAFRKAIERESELAIPSVVLGEYLFGVRNSRHRERYERFLRASEAILHTLPVRASTARHYADVRYELKSAGRPIPSNDVWIAAICREHRGRLASRDRHFEWVPGLTVVGW